MYVRNIRKLFRYLDIAVLDLICLNIAFLVSYRIHIGAGNPYAAPIYGNLIIMLCLADVLTVILLGYLSNIEQRGYYVEFGVLLKQCILVSLLGVLYLFLIHDAQHSTRATMASLCVFFIFLNYPCRVAWKKWFSKLKKRTVVRSMLIVTDKNNLQTAVNMIDVGLGEAGKIKGVVLLDKDGGESNAGNYPIVCTVDAVADYVCHNWVDEVLIVSDKADALPQNVLKELVETGVTIHIGLQLKNSMLSARQFVETYGEYNILTSCMNEKTPLQATAKRLMDICGGLIGCIFTAVIFLFLAPIIKISSPGPVFYKQKRVGQNGRIYSMYKFRSMHVNADQQKKDLVAANRVSDGMMFKLEFDPRVIGNKVLPDGTRKTGIGEFIRRTSLDEFPQFFNVLKGDMSLVGTRPPTLDEWQKYKPHHRARLIIKPGITGLWQVSGRSNITDFEQVVALDTEYINKWSIGLDIRLMLKTIIVLLKGDGAM